MIPVTSCLLEALIGFGCNCFLFHWPFLDHSETILYKISHAYENSTDLFISIVSNHPLNAPDK